LARVFYFRLSGFLDLISGVRAWVGSSHFQFAGSQRDILKNEIHPRPVAQDSGLPIPLCETTP